MRESFQILLIQFKNASRGFGVLGFRAAWGWAAAAGVAAGHGDCRALQGPVGGAGGMISLGVRAVWNWGWEWGSVAGGWGPGEQQRRRAAAAAAAAAASAAQHRVKE